MESVQRLGDLVSRLGYSDYEVDADGDITFLRSFKGDYAIEPSPWHLWTRFNFQFRSDYSVQGTFYAPTEEIGIKTDLAQKVTRIWLLRKELGLKVMVAPKIIPHSLSQGQKKVHIAVTASDERHASWNAVLNQQELVAELTPEKKITVAGGVYWDSVDVALDALIDKTCQAAGQAMYRGITGWLVNADP